MSHSAEPKLVDPEHLAAVFDVSSQVVIRLYREGRLPGYQLGKRHIRFDVGECLTALRNAEATPAGSREAAR